jgi:hypothetical protein
MAHRVVAPPSVTKNPETVSLLLFGWDFFPRRVYAPTQSYELTTADLLLHLERRRTAVEQI